MRGQGRGWVRLNDAVVKVRGLAVNIYVFLGTFF